jgi:hypothetical protein
MAVRRKPRAFRDGGRVPPVDMPESARAEGGEAPALEQSGPAPTADDDSPIKRQLEAIQRAEELQWQMAQRQAPTDMEGQMAQAGLRDEAKAWMRTHPEYWTDRAKNSEINTLHGYLTNNKRIAPFSREYFDKLESELGIRSGPPKPSAELDREIARSDDSPPRRSVPYAAPVTRGAPNLSEGSKVPTRIDLSPEERDMARRSYQNLPADQAERLYADMKRRMLIAKANGTLSQ